MGEPGPTDVHTHLARAAGALRKRLIPQPPPGNPALRSRQDRSRSPPMKLQPFLLDPNAVPRQPRRNGSQTT